MWEKEAKAAFLQETSDNVRRAGVPKWMPVLIFCLGVCLPFLEQAF